MACSIKKKKKSHMVSLKTSFQIMSSSQIFAQRTTSSLHFCEHVTFLVRLFDVVLALPHTPLLLVQHAGSLVLLIALTDFLLLNSHGVLTPVGCHLSCLLEYKLHQGRDLCLLTCKCRTPKIGSITWFFVQQTSTWLF